MNRRKYPVITLVALGVIILGSTGSFLHLIYISDGSDGLYSIIVGAVSCLCGLILSVVADAREEKPVWLPKIGYLLSVGIPGAFLILMNMQ